MRMIVSFCLAVLVTCNSATAGLLVGTFTINKSKETLANIQLLIDDYNSDFGAALPSVVARVDKIEDGAGSGSRADFGGSFSLGDFNFYRSVSSGGTPQNIFDASVAGAGSPVLFSQTPANFEFDIIDNSVMGYELNAGSSASFYYYVSKNANSWSLWTHMDGAFNPVYADVGTGDSSIVGSGFTRGLVSDHTLAYDPLDKAVSHISFYSATASSGHLVPEPSSIALFGAGVLCLIGSPRRRRRRML